MRQMILGVFVLGLAVSLQGQDRPHATKKEKPKAADPFAGNGSDDPFDKASAKQAKAAPKKNKTADPFGPSQSPGSTGKKAKVKPRRKAGNADPFGGGGNPFGGDDPFGDGSQTKKKATPNKSVKPKPGNPFGATSDPFADKSKKPTAKKKRAKRKKNTIKAALEETTQLEFFEAPLSECVDFLRELHGVSIYVDSKSLEEIGLGSDSPVTLNVSGVPLRYGLNVVCDSLDLAWMQDNEVIRITSREHAAANMRTVVYDVSAALGQQGTVAELAGVLKSVVTGPDASDSPRRVFTHRKSVVIQATEREHHLLAGLITNLVRCQDVGSSRKSDPQKYLRDLGRLSGSLYPAAGHTKVLAALDAKTTLEFFDAPLMEVTTFLTDVHAIPILIDGASLEEIGIGSDTPITQNLKDISLRAGLNLMLGELDLDWTVADDMLKIVTVEQARRRPTVRTYLIADLLSAEDTITNVRDMVSAALKLPTAESRDARRLAVRRTAKSKRIDRRQVLSFQTTLVVAATSAEHDKVTSLLKQLRRK